MKDISDLTKRSRFLIAAAMNLHPDSFTLKIEFLAPTTDFGAGRGIGWKAEAKVIQAGAEIRSFKSSAYTSYGYPERALQALMEEVIRLIRTEAETYLAYY